MDELDLEECFIEELYLLENNLWKTAKGEVIKIENMSDTHIKRAISYCVRNNFRIEFLPLLQEELDYRKKKKEKENMVTELLKGMHFLKHINSKEDLYACGSRLVIHNLIYNSLRVLSTRH